MSKSMFYVVTETGMQVDDGPFDTREDAEAWIREEYQRPGAFIRHYVLDDAGMDELEADQHC